MRIDNFRVGQIATEQCRLNIAEGVPNNLLPNVQPVIDLTPRNHRNTDIIATFNKTASGSSTVYTTPTDKDFYLCLAGLNISKDATSDNVTCAILATVGGVSKDILRVPMQTLTAIPNSDFERSFNKPVKIDRGTTITVLLSFTVGTITAATHVSGFLSD
jgi:hypothetical protein